MTSNTINLHKYSDLFYESPKTNTNALPVYGPYEKLFLTDWGQSEIHRNIVQAFNQMNITHMKPVQQNSFLYLMNNYNTAIVGFSKGKSTTYLASIFSLILNKSHDEMQVAIGPKAIILSSSLGSCSILEQLSKQLISSTNDKIKVVVIYSSMSWRTAIALLLNGCDVLISTPTSLYNILLKTKIFSWSNLRYFVFDNIDLLLENYKDQMVHFLHVLLKLKRTHTNIQMISASIKWTKDTDIFLNRLFEKWQYIFGSHLEAARHMKTVFNFSQVKDNKLEKVTENLQNNIKCRRCVLFSSNPDKLWIISNYIQEACSNIEVLLPGKLKSNNVYISQKWNEPLVKNQRLLICSDDMMFDFYIDNADCLIHYDIPDGKKTFSMRFSVLQDSNKMFVKKNRSTYIFLSNDSKDMLQLPKVVEIMKVFGNGEVAPVLLEHSKLIIETLEKEKRDCILCDDLLQFGFCPKLTTCKNRHILLKEIDEPVNNIPKSGLASVKILNIYDGSHFSAKLLKLNHTNNLNDVEHWSTVEDFFDIINHKLNLFYSNEKSRIIPERLNVGNIVAVHLDIKEERSTEYFRAIIIDVIDKNTMNPKVKVKLIDLGFIKFVSVWRVFILPDELKSIPTTTVDIFLTSVKPIDLDKTWCPQSNTYICQNIKYAEDCNNTFIIKIKMALRTTIWIKKLYKQFWNSKLKMYDFEAILPDILFNIGYADINNGHIEKLTELCISVGIDMPSLLKNNDKQKYEFSVKEFMSLYNLPEPQWAHLDLNNTVQVSLDYIISPKVFFVRNYKYYDRLNDLQAKITEYVEQKQVEKLQHFVIGAIGLTKYPETDQYNRVQITKLSNDRFIEVLFVDLGEFKYVEKNALLTIHPDLITQLPFQAIECGLSGVKDTLPTGDKLDEIIDFMFDLTQNILYLKVVDTISLVQFTGGSHYEVILFDDINTINFKFQTSYSQYCDDVQMTKIIDLVDFDNNLEVTDNDKNDKNYVINEDGLNNEDDMTPEDIESKKKLLHEFGLAVFGERFEGLNSAEDIENSQNDNSAKITEILEPPLTPVIDNKCTQDITTIDTIKEIKSVKLNEDLNPINITALKTKPAFKNRKLKLNIRRQNPCLTCNINLQSIIPMCIWYQDKNNIYLKFSILEIDHFNVNYTMQDIMFNAQFKDVSYAFHSTLYTYVIESSIIHRRSYEGFHIKAEKLYKTDYEWPRLFACSQWHSYVKYDQEHIDTQDLTLWIRGINKFKTIATGKPLNMMDEESSTDTSSESDNIYYDDIDD